MPTTRRIHLQPADNAVLVQGMANIRRELKLPTDFPPEVEAAAAAAAANPGLPELDRSEARAVRARTSCLFSVETARGANASSR